MSGIAYVDTETLGLNPDRHPIWEVAVILPDGPNEGEHVWQVRPTAIELSNADPIAVTISGFTDRYEDETAMRRGESIARFVDLVNGRHIVGAVPSFDEERLRREHNEFLGVPNGKYPWHYHVLDVEALALGFLMAARDCWSAYEQFELSLPWKSEDLGAALGVTPQADKDRHTALGDARWVRAVYERIIPPGERESHG